MSAERVRGKWTIYVCPVHGLTQLDATGECAQASLKGPCSQTPKRVEVVDVSALDELAEELEKRARMNPTRWAGITSARNNALREAASLIRSHRDYAADPTS